MENRDLLGECNDHNLPVGEFMAEFCNRPCYQRECTRSAFGKSRFEQRTANWQDRLFIQPPRMSNQDPRYEQLRGKRFLEMAPGPISEDTGRSAWVDPLAIPPPAIIEETPVAPVVVEAPQVEAPVPALVATQPTPSPMNTPFQQGKMIGSAQNRAKDPKVVYDPWATPSPRETDGVQIVKSGARIKLG